MNIDRLIFAFAITFVLVVFHSLKWLWFTAFVGANMLQASLSGFFPMATILKRIGLKPGEAFV